MHVSPEHREVDGPPRTLRVGCVSFLNTKPLIHGLEDQAAIDLKPAVPSRLLDMLLEGQVDVALCPAIDYQRSPRELAVVPAGAIGCDGATLTVRLFSRAPLDQITTIHADTDSHTSVALLRVLLALGHELEPELIDLDPSQVEAATDSAEAMLLIGDKVITAAPGDDAFPFQMDLGEAWREATGLPFVFATWMAIPDTPLGELAAVLDAQRRVNDGRVDAIVDRYAGAMGWPADLARDYLMKKLRFDFGKAQRQAMERFWRLAHELGVTQRHRPFVVHRDAEGIDHGVTEGTEGKQKLTLRE